MNVLTVISVVLSLYVYYVIFKVVKDGSYTVHR